MGKTTVLIDVSNLNVIYKDCDSAKFSLALNYANAVDRLQTTLGNLEAGFDIFLCVKPRLPREGDYIVEELSLTGLPFTVCKEEIHDIIGFFKSFNRVGDIYICNWVSNFVQMARVDTFESAFYYGDRVAHVSVKDRMLEFFKVYPSVTEFYELVGSNFGGYGELGVLDIDGFKAQYPEFARATHAQIFSLAPVVQSCKSHYRVTAESLLELMDKVDEVPVSGPALEPQPVQENVSSELDAPKEVGEPKVVPISLEEVPRSAPIGRTRWTISTVGLFLVSSILAGVLGCTFGITVHGKVEDRPPDYYTQIDNRVKGLRAVTAIYEEMLSPSFDTNNVFDFVGNSELGVTIAGFERYPDNYVVRCNCASDAVKDAFIAYIESAYSVLSTNDLGVVEVEGESWRQYAIMFG